MILIAGQHTGTVLLTWRNDTRTKVAK